MIPILDARKIHTGFHIGLILKGLFDLAEILGGILMLFLSPERMVRLITLISRKELLEDPTDFIMNYLVSYSQIFTMDTQHFTSWYLLSHGAVKMLAIILLWKKKLWAYPLSCTLFAVFIVFQLMRYSHTHSLMLLVLTLVDIVMIVLTVLEYRNVRLAK